MKITELKQKRAALFQQARTILDTADEQKRDLTAEERQQYDNIMADVDRLGEQIQREERMAEIASQIDTRAQHPFRPQPATDARAQNSRASQEYRDAYNRMLRVGYNALTGDEVRALQVGTDSEGGYLVPDEFERQLIDALQDQNVMRSLATVINTGSGDRIIPVVTSHGIASWINEEGDYTESDDAFDRVTLGAHKVGTLIKVSEELLRDSAFNLESYIASEFGRRIGRAEEAAFFVGDGNGKPTGIVGAAGVGTTTAVANAITADELIDLFHSLKRPYRANATFVMADSTAKVIRKLKDSDGQYLWQPGLVAGQPDRLLSRPVVISDDVPAIAATNKPIIFGDFKYYWIADRQGRVFQRLNELFATKGQVGFRAFQRVDGKLTLAEAVKVLQMKAS